MKIERFEDIEGWKQEYVSETEFAALYKQAKATRAVIGGFIKYLLTHAHAEA